MSEFDYDLFVIGAGSGGVRAARMAAGLGVRVGICEEYRYGGTCVIRGCIPKKLLVYASHYSEDFNDAAGFGWNVESPKFDWNTLIVNKDKEIDRLNGIYVNLLTQAGVDLFHHQGQFIDEHSLRVGDQTIRAERILIATGGTPFIPEFPGSDLVVSSNEAFHLDALPDRVLILGGGYIAVEFAGIFHGLGAKVSQAYRGTPLLRGFDDEIRHHLTDEMIKKGIDIQLEQQIHSIESHESGLQVNFDRGSEVYDCVLVATGRKPNTDGLNCELAGVDLNANGAVSVDDYSQTSQDHIYAVGDVTDRMNLTPVALHEAMAFVDTVYKNTPRKMNYETIASAVFSQPPIATVGLSESEAKSQYTDVSVFTSSFRALKNTLSGNPEKTFMKMLVDVASDRVLGCHMIGPDAAEIIQGVSIAMQCNATKAQFDATVGIHPTAAEEFVTMRSRTR